MSDYIPAAHITKDKAEHILSYGKSRRYMNVSRDVLPRALATVIAQAEQIERLQAAVVEAGAQRSQDAEMIVDSLVDLDLIAYQDMETPK